MCLRGAVPLTPRKSSVPHGLPFYKNRPLLTRPESTLLQVFIPVHFNSRRISVYKKPGEELSPSSRKVLQLVTSHSPGLRAHSNARNLYPFHGLPHGSLDSSSMGVTSFPAPPVRRPCPSGLRVCPFASFSYNAPPFAREVNRWVVYPKFLELGVFLVGAPHVYPELQRVVPSSPSSSLPHLFPAVPHHPPKPRNAAIAKPTACTPLAAPNSPHRSIRQSFSGASPAAKSPRKPTFSRKKTTSITSPATTKKQPDLL